MKTIEAVVESADFGPAYDGEDYVTLTFRVHKDHSAIAGVWDLTPKRAGTFPWAVTKYPDKAEARDEAQRTWPTKNEVAMTKHESAMRSHGDPCYYCKREMRQDVEPNHPLRATKDHYIPKSRRADGDENIIVMACFTCNNMKGDRFPEQWDRFMLRNPRWWLLRDEPRKPRQPVEPQPKLPFAHSKYILENGRKKYRQWVEDGCPKPVKMRPLRPDEPIPIEYDDPLSQAAFEAHSRKNRHNLRVPDEC